MADFSDFRKLFKLHIFLGCERLLTKSKSFEIRKIFPESLFISKNFKTRFRSLHHFDIWCKCLVNSCEINDRSFVNVRWRFGSDASWPTVELFWSLSCSTSAGVRSGQLCISAFCSWHEIGTARLLAWKNRTEMSPGFDLWPVFICVALSTFFWLSFWCKLCYFGLNVFYINIFWGLIFHEFHDFWRVNVLLADAKCF